MTVLACSVLRAQGTYYLVSGPPAIVCPRTFQALTGPKRDMWLAKTLGGLITIIGAVLLAGTRSNEPSSDLKLLASGSALALGTSDLIFGGKGRNTGVYYLDAVVQAALVAALAAAR